MLIYLASQSIPPLFLWGAGTAGGGTAIVSLFGHVGYGIIGSSIVRANR